MEIGIKIFGFILIIIDLITRPFFWYRSRKCALKLPPINDPILSTSATKLAHLIRKREISSLQVVKTFIERSKEVNPFINAIVEERFNNAIEEAKDVDKLIESMNDDEDTISRLMIDKPLLGIPITIKETCPMAGMSQSVGSIRRIGMKANKDCQAVSLIRLSGAIPILVSNTPELGLSWETNNSITGRTNNPYCLHRTSGGSSGGEAALIGSGASIIGIGADISGSIRIPTMFCGVFGHKPSPGIVSIDKHYLVSNEDSYIKFLTIGPLTRYAEDLETMLKIMAGQNVHQLNFEKKVNMREIKVLYMTEVTKSFLIVSVEKEIKAVLKKAVNYLNRECDSKVQEIILDEMNNSIQICISMYFGMYNIPTLPRDESNPKDDANVFVELIKSILGIGTFSFMSIAFYILLSTKLFLSKSSFQEYCSQAKLLKKKIEDALGENGVLLYPTFPTAAFYHNQVCVKTSGVLYTMIFNVLGLPSTHIPLGLNSKGLPIGIQVIAATNQDKLCFTVAKELEKGFGGWVPPF